MTSLAWASSDRAHRDDAKRIQPLVACLPGRWAMLGCAGVRNADSGTRPSARWGQSHRLISDRGWGQASQSSIAPVRPRPRGEFVVQMQCTGRISASDRLRPADRGSQSSGHRPFALPATGPLQSGRPLTAACDPSRSFRNSVCSTSTSSVAVGRARGADRAHGLYSKAPRTRQRFCDRTDERARRMPA